MSETAWSCRRCGKSEPRLAEPPFPGPLGAEIAASNCANCWAEWQKTEVMVINELKLNFMEPSAQDVLTGHLREFLLLDERPDPQPA
jgi:Fe-S cluster biosynthesis and repair protein YggX